MTNKDLKASAPCFSKVILQAAKLSEGKIEDTCIVDIGGEQRVHIWRCENKRNLILLQFKRNFIGIKSQNGSFHRIVGYYESKRKDIIKH